jgi:hypothetical protein
MARHGGVGRGDATSCPGEVELHQVDHCCRTCRWFGICAAFSTVAPFFGYAVIPIARKLCQPNLLAMTAAFRRRAIIS